MIMHLFNWLYGAINAAPQIALIASFLWGVLSILLSPCHLVSIPLVIGFIDNQGSISTKRAFLLASLFSLGILITIALIGFVTGLFGRMLGDIGSYGTYLVAAIFFLVGLHLLGLIPLPLLGQSGQPSFSKKGLLAALLLGLLFGSALGPCTFAYMAPMLGIVFSIAATKLFFAVLLMIAYALGHCSVIILAGTFTGFVHYYLKWNEQSRGAIILKKVCGFLVVLGGIYLIYTAP